MTTRTDDHTPAAKEEPDTQNIIRDALILQAKLVVDGLRDAILIPVSFFAALVSIVLPGKNRRLFFYEVVRAGRSSERWINLFAAADRVFPETGGQHDMAGLDELFDQVERQLRTQDRSDAGAESLLDRLRAARQRFQGRG